MLKLAYFVRRRMQFFERRIKPEFRFNSVGFINGYIGFDDFDKDTSKRLEKVFQEIKRKKTSDDGFEKLNSFKILLGKEELTMDIEALLGVKKEAVYATYISDNLESEYFLPYDDPICEEVRKELKRVFDMEGLTSVEMIEIMKENRTFKDRVHD